MDFKIQHDKMHEKKLLNRSSDANWMLMESYPITKVKQFAMAAAVLNSTLLLRSHQPYNKYIKIQITITMKNTTEGLNDAPKSFISFPKPRTNMLLL